MRSWKGLEGGPEPDSGGRPSRGAVLPALLLAAMVLLAFWFSLQTAGRGELVMGTALAAGAADELGQKLDRLLASGQVLKSALEANPSMGEAQTAALAEGILAGNPTLKGLSTAPGAVIDRYYPSQEGLAWKGHDLLSNPDRRDALLQAAEARSPVLAGPYESVDGSSSLFVRYPVYSGSKLWGFASLTADFPKLLSSLRLEARYPGIVFALADLSQPASPRLVAGKGIALAAGSASAPISRPGITWRIYVAPEAGGAASNPFLYALLAAGLSSAVLLFLARTRRPAAGKRPESRGPTHKVPDEATADEFPGRFGEAAQVAGGPLPLGPRARAQTAEAAAAERGSLEPSSSLFPDLGVVERKRGRVITFKGPAVKGDLFMPERLLTGWTEGGDPEAPPEPEPAARPAPTVPPEAAVQPAPIPPPESPPQAGPGAVAEPAPELGSAAMAPPAVSREAHPPTNARSALLFSVEELRPSRDKAILVVDDSEANRDILGRMLALRGYAADFAASGDQALDLAAAKAYDLVFMDCYMPGKDGCAAAAALRRGGGPSARALVVGMSARVGASELEKCRAAGMDELLSKPFTLKQILAFLERP